MHLQAIASSAPSRKPKNSQDCHVTSMFNHQQNTHLHSLACIRIGFKNALIPVTLTPRNSIQNCIHNRIRKRNNGIIWIFFVADGFEDELRLQLLHMAKYIFSASTGKFHSSIISKASAKLEEVVERDIGVDNMKVRDNCFVISILFSLLARRRKKSNTLVDELISLNNKQTVKNKRQNNTLNLRVYLWTNKKSNK